MAQYEIISLLGSGVFGETYKVKYKGKLYALKRQKILKTDINNKSTRSAVLREVNFFKWIKKLPEAEQQFFAVPEKVEYTKNCQLTETRDQNLDPYLLKQKEVLNKSTFCIDILMDLKDGVVDDLVKLSKKERYSICIQILYALYLMHKNGYVHGDIHAGNIAYKKIKDTKKLTLIFGDKKIKIDSCGYQISLIDYGFVLNRKFNLTENEMNNFNWLMDRKNDVTQLLSYLTNIDGNEHTKPCIGWRNVNHKNDRLLHKIYKQNFELYLLAKARYVDKNGQFALSYFKLIEQDKFDKAQFDKAIKSMPFFNWFATEILVILIIDNRLPIKDIIGCNNLKFMIDDADLKLISSYRSVDEMYNIIKILAGKIVPIN